MRPTYPPTNETRITGGERRIERLERRPLVYSIVEEIKIFSDLKSVKVGDGRFKLTVSDDVVGLDVIQFKTYVTTTGATCTCMLQNKTQNWNILTTGLSIPSGSYHAKTTNLVTIDETKNAIALDDRLWINVTAAGGKGLGVIIVYGRDRRP